MLTAEFILDISTVYYQFWIRIYKLCIKLSNKRTVSQESSILGNPCKRCPVVPSVHVQGLVLKFVCLWIPEIPVPVDIKAYYLVLCFIYPHLALLSP